MPVRLYGTTEVVGSDDPRPVSGAKERAVLAYLVVQSGNVVKPDVLLEAFWPDRQPDQAIRSLRVRVANIRRTLQGSRAVLKSTSGGYLLEIGLEDVDLWRFQRLVGQARVVQGEERLRYLDEAAALRTGAPLAEFSYDDFAQPAIRADTEIYREALQLRATALLDTDRPDAAIATLVPEFENAPDHEPFAAALMRAYAQSGRVPDALDVFRRLSSSLAIHGLVPSAKLAALEESVLLGHFDDTAWQTNRLPHRPTLIGRETDQLRLVEAIRDHRFVTVVGPPGAGKTSLAIAAGHEIVAVSELSAVLVDLTTVHDGEAGVRAIADAVGAGAEAAGSVLGAVLDRVTGRRLMLLLDNCEHLVPELTPFLAQLLERAPTLAVLATSRVPFGAAEEHRLPLDPLAVPPADATPAEIEDSPAFQLFVQRAGAVRPGFDGCAENTQIIADLCRALDGLPLAIELAASRATVLSPRQIWERISDQTTLLSDATGARPAHHRTLQTTIAWSIDMLSDSASHLLAILSVFRGGFDLGAAEVVSDPKLSSSEVLDGLAELVAHSLVLIDAATEPPRYRLLESIAAAASETLAVGEQSAVHRRHRRHIIEIAKGSSGGVAPVKAGVQLAVLDTEAANLRRVLDLAIVEAPHEAAEILADSWFWWRVRGHWAEGAELANRLLNSAVPADRAARYRFYRAATWLILFGPSRPAALMAHIDDTDATAARLGEAPDRQARALALRLDGQLDRAVELHRQEAEALTAVGRSARADYANIASTRILQGRHHDARTAAEAARREAHAHDETELDTTLVTIAEIDLIEERFHDAAHQASDWIDQARTGAGETGFLLQAMIIRVIAEVRAGQIESARQSLPEMLRLSGHLGRGYLHNALVAAGFVAMQSGGSRAGVRLVGAASPHSGQLNKPWLLNLKAEIEEAGAAAGLNVAEELAAGADLSTIDAMRLAHSLVPASTHQSS